MDSRIALSRRMIVKSSVFGLLAAGIPNVLFAKGIIKYVESSSVPASNSARYPAIDESVVAEVVGVSHFDLSRLKVLVNGRPELARATWDWGFGDWETAIGAASHTGRKDIAEYLLSMGARPDIFTFSMLGCYPAVRSMIESTPGVHKITGPHGISLIQHAKAGLLFDSSRNNEEGKKLVVYLESINSADDPPYQIVTEEEKVKYVGDYKYGEGFNEGFTIKLNMKKIISLGKLGKSGGALYKIADNQFIYNGTTSVRISFTFQDDRVVSLTLTEPGLTLIARKV